MKIELTETTVREIRSAVNKALTPSHLMIDRLEGGHRIGDEDRSLLVAFLREQVSEQ